MVESKRLIKVWGHIILFVPENKNNMGGTKDRGYLFLYGHYLFPFISAQKKRRAEMEINGRLKEKDSPLYINPLSPSLGVRERGASLSLGSWKPLTYSRNSQILPENK